MRAEERARLEEVLQGMVVCPACGGRLALVAEAVRCQGCGREYPVVDGLPVLLVDRARQ